MNAAMYRRRPDRARDPDHEQDSCCAAAVLEFWIVLRNLLDRPRRELADVVDHGGVADGPTGPRIETRARIAGKIARIP